MVKDHYYKVYDYLTFLYLVKVGCFNSDFDYINNKKYHSNDKTSYHCGANSPISGVISYTYLILN